MQSAMKDVVESLAEQTKALNKQTEALISNTIGKECKSNIYDKINVLNERVGNIEDDINCDKKGRPGIWGQINILTSKIEVMQQTLFAFAEKSREDIKKSLEPIIKNIEISNENISKINERNLKKDAISNWKLSFPAGVLTILSIIQVIMFIIKG